MKNVFCFLFILIAFPFYVCFGQDKPQVVETAWTQIETENKELSVAFPADFLVDAKTDDFDQRYRVFGFENGVSLEMRITKPDDPKKQLNQITVEPSEYIKHYSILFNGITGKNVINKKIGYSSNVFLAYKDNFYHLSVSAPNEGQIEVDRFLCSIMIKDKPLFTCKNPLPETNNKTVSLLSLQTSPKVLEALSRKSDGKEGKISYQTGTPKSLENNANGDFSKRSAIILDRGVPTRIGSRGNIGIPNQRFTIRVQVTLLANGQIGDVTVFAPVNLDKSMLKKFVDAARKTKFIPAEEDGKPVDTQELLVYSFVN